MERTKVKSEETPVLTVNTPIRWQKTGGGSFYLGNRIIKPGEKFYAPLGEIPKVFRDAIDCLEPEKLQAIENGEAVPEVEETLYYLKKVKGQKGLFNIVDSEGKFMNEEPLTEEAAQELLTGLNQ